MEISQSWISSLSRFETDHIKAYLDINDPKDKHIAPQIDKHLK